MILDNGVVRTLDPSLAVARALAIAGGRIAGGVGARARCLAGRRGSRRPLRAPGFTDSHVHFATWAVAQAEVRLENTHDSRKRSSGFAPRCRQVKPGGWLRGRGWRAATGPVGRADEANERNRA